MGLLIVLALRLIAPLTVLRSPFWGALLAIAADTVDILIFQATDFPDIGYHRADKLLDAWYLLLFAVTAQRWLPLPRWTATALFGYRVIGFVLYEVTGARVFLFIFPNVFEFWFVFYASVTLFWPAYEMTRRRTALWIAVLLLPKMAQEYALHYAQWLDRLTFVEAMENVLDAIRRAARTATP